MGNPTEDNFTFKCHRAQVQTGQAQDIYPVNGITFHPKFHSVLATVGSDGKYMFWDKENRTSKTTLASRLLLATSMPTGQSSPMLLGTIGIGATRQTIQMSSQRLSCAM